MIQIKVNILIAVNTRSKTNV